MRKKTMKINWLLLYYSGAVTALLILVFYIFVSTISVPKSNLPKHLFVANEKNIAYSMQGESMEIPFNDKYTSVVTKTNLENYYISALLKNIPILIICIIGMFIVGTIILSKILRRQNEEQALLLAKQLCNIGEENSLPDQHPAVVKEYQKIKDRLAAYALDYVRLSSYVTHEQKNILALLRAKLQLSENSDYTAEVDKLTDSLNDVLTLSATKDSGETEIVDVALVCADVCDEYRKIYPQVDFNFDDYANNLVYGRELWISRAVSNLVSNAIKYGGSGEIQVSVENKKGSIIITVSDEGEGIDEEEQEKLFDYQYRVGKLKRNGYGIGLSIVRHVCELCGGICWVENRDVRGTTFFMILPEALTLD
ncbi:HAMP domain-containing histidine kinase [Clostridium sp. CM028]|uniref:sensor histidine kinase n=1 Tax=unclassified Clostridium TaxID=2614128 RepID=UPI001C0D163A|nr:MULTISPECIES: HAMP domain-containing sensor histidine kinase [unclassified Clostridium]MBU3093116.1 HAMP domain-containing histidine kinase [Clostridium sp. CF011]MBW9150296.1 HAMP domain-containing histidine kinase [Clostridium sp. CM028]WAG68438.1 HAMP domain-containing histidine kinase [Clostridium sp. CF011]WLC63255.1 HAMP domain-containing histidine kinase [Clostridium sp. CM028]